MHIDSARKPGKGVFGDIMMIATTPVRFLHVCIMLNGARLVGEQVGLSALSAIGGPFRRVSCRWLAKQHLLKPMEDNAKGGLEDKWLWRTVSLGDCMGFFLCMPI